MAARLIAAQVDSVGPHVLWVFVECGVGGGRVVLFDCAVGWLRAFFAGTLRCVGCIASLLCRSSANGLGPPA